MEGLGFGFQQFFNLLHDAGAAAAPIFALLWWLERGERLENRRQDEERATRRDLALNEVRLALAALTAIFNSRSFGR